jgi:ElaB/YqjD/DUF883 family membrane-anchored ribosome-binding protein
MVRRESGMTERSEHAGATRSKRTTGKDVGDTLQETKDQVRDTAQDALDEMKSQASSASDAAQRQAGDLVEQVRDAAESLLYEQKDRMAEAVHSFAEALHRAADELGREDKATAARYAEQAAEQIDRFSTTMRNQRLQDLVAAGEDFARRQPALFIAGAVAAGVLVGRLLARPTGERPASSVSGYAVTADEGGYHDTGYKSGSEPVAGYGAIAETMRQP